MSSSLAPDPSTGGLYGAAIGLWGHTLEHFCQLPDELQARLHGHSLAVAVTKLSAREAFSAPPTATTSSAIPVVPTASCAVTTAPAADDDDDDLRLDWRDAFAKDATCFRATDDLLRKHLVSVDLGLDSQLNFVIRLVDDVVRNGARAVATLCDGTLGTVLGRVTLAHLRAGLITLLTQRYLVERGRRRQQISMRQFVVPSELVSSPSVSSSVPAAVAAPSARSVSVPHSLTASVDSTLATGSRAVDGCQGVHDSTTHPTLGEPLTIESQLLSAHQARCRSIVEQEQLERERDQACHSAAHEVDSYVWCSYVNSEAAVGQRTEALKVSN